MRRTIAEMMAKDRAFEQVQAGDAEVVQEPTEQPWRMRDCAFRDPRET